MRRRAQQCRGDAASPDDRHAGNRRPASHSRRPLRRRSIIGSCHRARCGSRTTSTMSRSVASSIVSDVRITSVPGRSRASGSPNDHGSSPEAMPAGVRHSTTSGRRNAGRSPMTSRHRAASRSSGGGARRVRVMPRAARCGGRRPRAARGSAGRRRPRCATAMRDRVDELGIVLRAGLDRVGTGDQRLHEALDHADVVGQRAHLQCVGDDRAGEAELAAQQVVVIARLTVASSDGSSAGTSRCPVMTARAPAAMPAAERLELDCLQLGPACDRGRPPRGVCRSGSRRARGSA